MNFEVSFDKNNSNCLILSKDDKVILYVALPEISQGCDIISFHEKINTGYCFRV